MPFIVTTKRPAPGFYSAVLSIDPDLFGAEAAAEVTVSRRAVATLEEDAQSNVKDEVARIMLRAGVVQQGQFWARAILGLTEAGGTVGPLPDGTLIEVEPTTYVHLARDGDWQWPQDDTDYSSPARHGAEVIAAFNARAE